MIDTPFFLSGAGLKNNEDYGYVSFDFRTSLLLELRKYCSYCNIGLDNAALAYCYWLNWIRIDSSAGCSVQSTGGR
jgi:hypothetical protein